MRQRRFARVLVLAISLTTATASVALGADPISWKRSYSADNTQLTWRFGGTSYPQWVTDRVREALEGNWDDPATNNSRTAQFVYSEAGLGKVVYSSSINSPCNPANAIWLASACTGGRLDWKIYVRNLDVSKYSNWRWWDNAQSCPSGTCFQLRRTLIHEPIHLTGGGSTHSTQSPDLTVFLRGQASNAHAIGRYYKLRACDQAGAQTAYDLRDLAGPYSTCLGTLKTAVTTNGTFEACQGLPVLVGGRLAISDSTYSRLNGNPLAGRTVKLELDGAVVATLKAYSNASGNNWALWLISPTPGIRTYAAHFDGESPLGASTLTFAVAWVPRSEC